MTLENSTRSLQPAEELRLQQLLQMQFWHRKHSDAESIQEASANRGAELLGLPEEWELTRGIELHSWQNECVDNWFAADHRGVIKVVTGAGKTILAIAIAERLQRAHVPDLRVAIVVPATGGALLLG